MKININTATQIAAKICAGEHTSEEVVNAVIRQIEEQNPALNAIVTTDFKQARKRAKEADVATAAGESWGALHGVPITIKDTYRVRGMLATAGYLPLKNYIPDEDAVIVRLLKEAGAIILGKTNTSMLAMDMQTNNPVYGQTNNPWDITRTPAGSSGGGATALASGMSFLSFGSDLAGSLRLPAGFCGVYGLKPTHGVVSMNGHIPPLPDQINGFHTLAVPGPLARSVDDLTLALEIITQPNAYDRKVAPLMPSPIGEINISQLKIAWTDDFGGVPVNKEIKEKLRGFVTQLAELGAEVHHTEPEGIDYNEVWELWGTFVGAQSNYEMSNFMRGIGDFFTKSTVQPVPMHRKIVGPITVPKLMRALDLQRQYITMMDNFLSEYDVWITPLSSSTAFKHHAHSSTFGDFKVYDNPLSIDGESVHYYVATQSYPTILSTTDSPVVSMPIGLDSSGLPINIQVAGKRYSDFRLLAIANMLDRYSDKFRYPFE